MKVMVQRETIPITFFERIKDIMDVLCPSFFESSVPDLKKFHDASQRELRNATKRDVPKLKALIGLKEMVKNAFEVQLNRVVGVHAFFEKCMQENGSVGKDVREVEDAMDELYIAKQITTFDENGLLKLPYNKDDEILMLSYGMDRMIWTFHRFNKRGRKTFRLEEQLTNELFLTDVHNVDSAFLKFPYPAICLYLPFNNKLTIRKNLIRYVYITERLRVGGDVENERKVELIYITTTGDVEINSFNITDGWLVNQIEEQTRCLWNASPLANREAREIISFVLGAMLYINSTEVEYKNVFPIVFQKKQDSRFPVCSLGYNIQVDKRVHYVSDGGQSERHINVLKWTVRGHFRTYIKGDHWKEDRTVWIRPYIKGKERDNSEQIIKPTNYLVQ